MADKPLGWLDEEAAERLLRGEPVLPAPGTVRERAEVARLAAFLGELSGAGREFAPGSRRPGQDAALAAFRATHASPRDSRRGTAGIEHRARRRAQPGRLPRLTGRIRPLRAAVAMALLACTAGGVAVASTSGVLTPSPDDRPQPSASAPAPPGTSGSPDRAPAPGASASADGAGEQTGGKDRTDDPDGSPRSGGPADATPTAAQLNADCRAYLAAQESGGRPDRETMGRLTKAAGGASKVPAYCDRRIGATAPDEDAGKQPPSDGTSGTGDSGTSDSGTSDSGGSDGPDGSEQPPAQDAESGAATGEDAVSQPVAGGAQPPSAPAGN
ncbi:hypothetical protein ACFQLX_04165 [Streptomyces polyrhachis]|uniref:Uncharacterized protein n=1 Tax=Streptomyces polyrhachis TaxID=1282885 RepID=A0ABW2G9H2_9ACTN